MSKKKITSLLVLLVSLFMSTNTFAQLAEVKNKAITAGTAVTEFQENTWYLLYQARVINADVDALLQPGEQAGRGGYLWDGASANNNSVYKKAATNLDSNPAPIITDENYAAYLVRFFSTGEDDTYKIQFGTGNYLIAPGTANGTNLKSSNSIYDATEFNLYTISDENPAVFGFNVAPFGACIDNNGNGYGVVTWGSGKHTNVEYGNSKWNIVSVELSDVDPKELAYQNLLTVFNQYYGYYDSFTPGTEPGQYGEAEVAAFRAALDKVMELDGPDSNIDEMTIEDFERLAEEIKEAYKAVVNSLVNLSMANGYYRIKNGGRTFEETITDEETGTTETVLVDKYMYVAQNGTTLNGVWGSVDDLSTHAPSLWKLTDKGEGKFELINVAFDAQFNKSAGQGNAFTLQTDSTELMYIQNSPIENDGTHSSYITIRVASQTASNLWLHMGGHGNGSGKSGNLIAYYNTDIASEWELVSVTDEDAQAIIDAYAPIKDREAMLVAYDSIMTNAKANLEIAYDLKKIVHDGEGEALITDPSQFSSPYTQTTEGAQLTDNAGELLDGNASTFWHSAWSGGVVAMDLHYLQIELTDTDVQSAVAVMGRRAGAADDHVLAFNVRGTNDPEAEKADCELLGTIHFPFGAAGELGVVSDVFEIKGYKYLRFYAAETIRERGYFHLSEFQLYPAETYQSETAQSIMLGDLYTNLKTVVDAQKDLEEDDIQLDEYNALKAAYDAFMAKFVDPTELRNTMKSVDGVLATITMGTNPGFWSDSNAGDAFKATYDAAEAYDAAGVYTTEQSADYVEALNNQYKNIYASANSVKEGKWYNLHFGTEEDYDNHEWDKTSPSGSATIPSFFDKFVSVASYVVDEVTNEQYVESIEPENVAVGHTLRMLAKEDMTYPDNAQFRFIAVGDSAYMLQNKGTGLFLKAAGATGAVTLSAHPTLFNVKAIGYGFNVIAAKNLTGANQNYLHIQASGNQLVTWNAFTTGSNSAFYVEEAGDVAADYDGTLFNVALKPGAVTGYCFPVEISVPEDTDAQMWTVNGVNAVDADSTELSIALAKIEGNVAPAGRPFILVYGDQDDYNAETESDMVVLKHGYAIGAKEAETDKVLKGTFTGGTLAVGRLMAEGNSIVVNKRSTTSIAANSAYIHPGWTVDVEATLEVVFDDSAADGIQSALQSVSHSGAVYTIDGRLVSKKAGLNDLQKFGKGTYILNGTKVIVK